jgi:hypothetical protein
VGSALCRTALGAFLRAAREMSEHGTFGFAKEAANPKEISEILPRNGSLTVFASSLKEAERAIDLLFSSNPDLTFPASFRVS